MTTDEVARAIVCALPSSHHLAASFRGAHIAAERYYDVTANPRVLTAILLFG